MSVLILGAGAAGMCCAFELEREGVQAQLIEARSKPGGRCFTVRRGTKVVEEGHADQTCNFRDGLYLNPGPARIPQHHVTVAYCRELGVPLEPFINSNSGAFLHGLEGPLAGQRVPFRDVEHDLRGLSLERLVAALRAECGAQGLDAEERALLIAALSSYAGLTDAGVYTGEGRRTPNAGPHPLRALLESKLAWKLAFLEEHDMQPTMLQVVGGTDRLTDAFAARLDSPIHLSTVVREILVDDDGVRVRVEDERGVAREVRSARCVVTLPLPVLARIPNNLPQAFNAAVRTVEYETAVKVGFETGSRWWETRLGVHGGMTFTDLPSTQHWYPSMGFGSSDGVLLGAYNFGEQGVAFSDAPPEQRLSRTIQDVEVVHGLEADARAGVSVAWRNVPWSRGAYAKTSQASHPMLVSPHPRLRLAGEHMSRKTAWIAGALESGADAARWLLSKP